MVFVDGLISGWSLWAIIIMSGIFFYETLVLDVSFDADDSEQ